MAGTLEANKLIAGVLTAGVIFVGAAVLSDILYHPTQLAENAYPIQTEDATQTAEAEAEPEMEPLPVRLASGTVEDGESAFRACSACHNVEQGSAHMVGPNLWNIVGSEIAAKDGFGYSDALASKEGEWTYESLDAWLENPSEWAPGTSMSYAGLKDPETRASMLLYLRSLSEDPEPLPEPEAETASAEGEATETASAEGEASGAADTGGGGAEETSEAQAVAADQSGGSESADAGQADNASAGTDGTSSTETAAADDAAADSGGDSAESAEGGATAGERSDEGDTSQTAAGEGVGDAAGGSGGAAAGGTDEVAMRVAEASVSDGESAFRACSACHTVQEGRPHRVGPNLWAIVGSEIAAKDGFGYSDALAGKEGEWTYAKLDAWLADPRSWAPGTSMAYAGLSDPEARAAVIAYLRSLDDEPAPLPETEASSGSQQRASGG